MKKMCKMLFLFKKPESDVSLRVKPADTSSWSRGNAGKRDLSKPPETLKPRFNRRGPAKQADTHVSQY